ncbi:hypothetical protein [Georgenia sp. SUBG003]|uniref:hypothetical protein n=1 Tax=Georgenia sp. SUBG003 TaxID=1497974 RepID=UPI003AB75877
MLIWSDELVGYDFGVGHPMAPIRLVLTHELLSDLGLLDLPGLEILPAPLASDDDLRLVHTADYVAAVREAEEDGRARPERGAGRRRHPRSSVVCTPRRRASSVPPWRPHAPCGTATPRAR